MTPITREMLASYLEDALTERETAQIEQALRESETLRQQLRTILAEMDRGEHSIGAIWRRNRLTCPSREQLGSLILGALDSDLAQYLEFHLNVVGCSFCQANYADLENQHQEAEPVRHQRRRKVYESSVGLLPSEQK